MTVAGPTRWPLPGGPPEGIDFIGHVSREAVVGLMDYHDLLVMPSRMEGFGIVFLEALARGLPCIGRDAFAMPEIIEDGVTGALIGTDDPHELADAIHSVLIDDSIYQTVLSQADDASRRYSWDNTARAILEIIRNCET